MSVQRRQLLQILSYAFGCSVIPLRNQFAIAAQNPAQPASPATPAKATAKQELGGTEIEKVAGIGGLFFRAHDPVALGRQWVEAANLTSGRVFRRVHKIGKAWGEGLTEKAVWHVVREYAAKAGIDKLAPHDLRRACARLCHTAGGELEQIQSLLGHVSIQTTERYLGCKQWIQGAVNDKIGIEPPD